MLKHRLPGLAASLLTGLAAALCAALPAASASATTPVAASGHDTAAASAAGTLRVRGMVLRRGLVNDADCEYIQFYGADDYISGNGVNAPVTLKTTGNCFSRMYSFPDPAGGTGYEYQNGDGHCLWDNNGTIEVGAACESGHPREEFYAYNYQNGIAGTGWYVTDMAEANAYMGAVGCVTGDEVAMATSSSCYLWNFPAG